MCLLALALSAGCSDGSEPAARAPETPIADSESWDVRIQLRAPDVVVAIAAPYLADDLALGVARADSGVSVRLERQDGSLRCALAAERLALWHREPLLTLAGRVRAEDGRDLVLEADTLQWDGAAGQVHVPGPLRLAAASGWHRGADLVADADLLAWSLRAVEGAWRRAGAYEVAVRAALVRGSRAAGYELEYDDVEVAYSGVRATGPRAVLSEGCGTLAFPRGFAAADGRLALSADSAVVELEQDRLAASGRPAVFAQAERTIAADSLRYDRKRECLRAAAGVAFTDTLVRLWAGRLEYDRRTDQARAAGGVRVEAARVGARLAADTLTYDGAAAAAVLEGNAVATRARADTGAVEVRAGRLIVALAAGELLAEGGVTVAAPEGRLSAGSGCFREADSLLVLADGPQWRQAGPGNRWHSRARADSMRLTLAGDSIDRVELRGDLELTIADGVERSTWVTGRGGVLALAGGRLDSVVIGSDAELVHRDRRRGEASRSTGQQMLLRFDPDGLRRVRVLGGATLVSRLVDAGSAPDSSARMALNRVASQELEIRFAQERMEVEVGPGVDGVYRPAPGK